MAVEFTGHVSADDFTVVLNDSDPKKPFAVIVIGKHTMRMILRGFGDESAMGLLAIAETLVEAAVKLLPPEKVTESITGLDATIRLLKAR